MTTEKKFLFKEFTIDCDSVDIGLEMFEKIHSFIQCSSEVDLHIDGVHYRFENRELVLPEQLTLSPVEIRLNLMRYRTKITSTRDLQQTELYKRLDKIRKVEGKNKLHQQALDIVRNATRKMVIFDPFGYDDLSGMHTHEYLFAHAAMMASTNLITTQMALLDIAWDHDYDVYIVNNDSKIVMITLENQEHLNISRQLRREHNLYKMWRAGGLGDQFL
jgi:hypothetical protein